LLTGVGLAVCDRLSSEELQELVDLSMAGAPQTELICALSMLPILARLQNPSGEGPKPKQELILRGPAAAISNCLGRPEMRNQLRAVTVGACASRREYGSLLGARDELDAHA
jgi:hypothetical protein